MHVSNNLEFLDFTFDFTGYFFKATGNNHHYSL